MASIISEDHKLASLTLIRRSVFIGRPTVAIGEAASTMAWRHITDAEMAKLTEDRTFSYLFVDVGFAI